MDERTWMAEQFEAHRKRLRAVAYRMLGNSSEADDAVQEAWLRLNRADARAVENMHGWLTTVVARVCLNVLRSRASRREEPVTPRLVETLANDDEVGPDDEMLLADSMGVALLVVLERLPPAERLAFVLHDMFDVPFDEIAPIVGRSPAAARQLASRGRRRIQGAPSAPSRDHTERQRVVEAFLAASRTGDFAALLAVLDPAVVLRFDGGAAAESERRNLVVHGAEAVLARSRAYSRFARFCTLVLVNGAPGMIMAPPGRLMTIILFRVEQGKIAEIDIVSDPARQRKLDVTIPDGKPYQLNPEDR